MFPHCLNISKCASLALTCCLVLCSCGGSDSDITEACDDLGLETRVLYGTRCQQDIAPVVYLELQDDDGDEVGTCSGTVIAPTKILTAAHCVVGRVDQLVARVGNERIRSVRLSRHPQAEVDDGQLESSDRDIAVVTLERSVSVTPVALLASRPTVEGETFAIFGYGLDEDGDSEVLRSGTMRVDDVNPSNFAAEHTDSTSGACFGDSGGPAIVEFAPGSDTSPVIAGVTSGIAAASRFPIPPFPLAGPFPLPFPFGTSEEDCEEGAVNYYASIADQAVLDFIVQQAPEATFR